MIIRNNILPPKGFVAINIFGILFVRRGIILTERTIRHERIHTRQIIELLGIFFYIWYVVEWLVLVAKRNTNPYRNISFEREAYQNDQNKDYLKQRKPYAFIKYIQ